MPAEVVHAACSTPALALAKRKRGRRRAWCGPVAATNPQLSRRPGLGCLSVAATLLNGSPTCARGFNAGCAAAQLGQRNGGERSATGGHRGAGAEAMATAAAGHSSGEWMRCCVSPTITGFLRRRSKSSCRRLALANGSPPELRPPLSEPIARLARDRRHARLRSASRTSDSNRRGKRLKRRRDQAS